jgi:hypothetical protein
MRYKAFVMVFLMIFGVMMLLSCRPKVHEKPSRFNPELDGVAVRPLPSINKDAARAKPVAGVREGATRPKPTGPTEGRDGVSTEPPDNGDNSENAKKPTAVGGG